MKNLTIQEITEHFLSKDVEKIGGQKMYDTLSDCIGYAWNNWESNIIETYYSGEKPYYANEEFICDWIENELENNPEEWDSLFIYS